MTMTEAREVVRAAREAKRVHLMVDQKLPLGRQTQTLRKALRERGESGRSPRSATSSASITRNDHGWVAEKMAHFPSSTTWPRTTST